MTAPLLFFFMANADTPVASTSTAVDVVSIATMDGGKNKRVSLPPKDRVKADQDFWDVREAYLKSLVSAAEAPVVQIAQPAPPVETQKAPDAKLVDVTALVQERSDLMAELRAAETMGRLKEVGARLLVVNAVLKQEQAKKADADKAELARQKRLLEIRIAKRQAAMELARIVEGSLPKG